MSRPTVVIACVVSSSGSRSPHRQPIPRRLRPRGRSRPQHHEQTSPTLHSSLWCLHGMARIKSTMSDNYLRTANFDSSPRKFSMPSRRFARALLISCLSSISYRRCNRATAKSACDGASSPKGCRSGSPKESLPLARSNFSVVPAAVNRMCADRASIATAALAPSGQQKAASFQAQQQCDLQAPSPEPSRALCVLVPAQGAVAAPAEPQDWGFAPES